MISAVILAAGQSVRMGRPKQVVLLAGRPLVEYAYDALLSSSVDEVVAVIAPEMDLAADIAEQKGVRVVVNNASEKGMSSSLVLGVASVKGSAVVVALGDQPLVLPSTIDALAAAHGAGAKIAVPTYRGERGNPVLFDRSLFGEIAMLKGDVGAKSVVKDNADLVKEVPVEDEGILLDVDTPADLAKAEKLVGLRSG